MVKPEEISAQNPECGAVAVGRPVCPCMTGSFPDMAVCSARSIFLNLCQTPCICFVVADDSCRLHMQGDLSVLGVLGVLGALGALRVLGVLGILCA